MATEADAGPAGKAERCEPAMSHGLRNNDQTLVDAAPINICTSPPLRTAANAQPRLIHRPLSYFFAKADPCSIHRGP